MDHHMSWSSVMHIIEECEVYPECEAECQQFIPYDRGYEDA